ncbi:MAG: hypothetical protein JXB14_04105, partial [Candidatus Altiarchaeota archaeon]|nr:hypothetical protein [Candidatus Altiarchaeota archaeon]
RHILKGRYDNIFKLGPRAEVRPLNEIAPRLSPQFEHDIILRHKRQQHRLFRVKITGRGRITLATERFRIKPR